MRTLVSTTFFLLAAWFLTLSGTGAIPVLEQQPIPHSQLERPIVTPFVIPTLLACLAAALRHPDSWTDAVGYALRLGGDVDTTGAITGGLLGARLGVAAIPPHLAAGVVDAERLRAVGTRLARWIERVSP